MTAVSKGGKREIAWTEDGWSTEGPLFRALAIVPARLLPGFARTCADSDSLHGQSLAAALRYDIEDVSPDALLCAVLVAASGVAGAVEERRPNLVLIVLDDFGVDLLGAFPRTEVAARPPCTPNLDALARDGLLFTHVWTDPVCSPSRAIIETGQYQGIIDMGAGAETGMLDPLHTTIPEALHDSNAAFSCGYFGKWHLSNGPEDPHDLYDYDHFSGNIGNLDAPRENYFQWTRHTVGDKVPYFSELVTTYSTTAIVDDALRVNVPKVESKTLPMPARKGASCG